MINDCRGAYLPSTIKCGFYSEEKVLFEANLYETSIHSNITRMGPRHFIPQSLHFWSHFIPNGKIVTTYQSLHTKSLHTKRYFIPVTSYQAISYRSHFIPVTSYRSHFIPTTSYQSLHTKVTSYQSLHTEVTSYQATSYQCISYQCTTYQSTSYIYL